MSAAIAMSNDSMVMYQGWLQGVQEGQRIRINGKIYLAKEVSSRKTIYELSGVSRIYYAKKVVEKIIQPIAEKIKCKISSLLSKSKPDSPHPLKQFATKAERHAQLNKRLHRKVQVLQVVGLQALRALELTKPKR